MLGAPCARAGLLAAACWQEVADCCRATCALGRVQCGCYHRLNDARFMLQPPLHAPWAQAAARLGYRQRERRAMHARCLATTARDRINIYFISCFVSLQR